MLARSMGDSSIIHLQACGVSVGDHALDFLKDSIELEDTVSRVQP